MTDNQFKNITLQQMESLVCLVWEGNFTRAAEKLCLTQPSLTKHIRNMEDALGFTLVNRSTVGITLTAEGKILYQYAKRVFKLREEAREKILRAHEDSSGDIYISASTIPATYILPRVLGKFKGMYPRVGLRVYTADSEETVQMILSGDAELGFIGKESLNKKLVSEALWKDCLILVVPAHHDWSSRATVSLDELSKEHFVAREVGSGTRESFEKFLQKNVGKSLTWFNVVCELGSTEAVKEAVISGLGVSVLSVYAVERELRQSLMVAVPIEGYTIKRYFYLIYKAQLSLMAYHRRFIDILKDYQPSIVRI
jgi:DNA-binding transcriptional LysR family regulator